MQKIKTADFHLIDQQIKNLNQETGVILIPSSLAWEKYDWVKQYLLKKPDLGYFLWVKKSQKKPLSSCISLETAGFKQKLNNLVVIETGVKAKILAVCNSLYRDRAGSHLGRSKVIVKEKASLNILHQHFWGPKNQVKPQIDFWVAKQGQLIYTYKNLTHPQKLDLKTRIFLDKQAKADSQVIVEAEKNQVNIDEALILNQKNAAGNLILRLVGKTGSQIKAKSQIEAKAAGRGHLDCQGLIVNQGPEINLIPQLLNKNSQALITHEASIGKIEKDKLEYLQSRGLTEKQAAELIIKGFLKPSKS